MAAKKLETGDLVWIIVGVDGEAIEAAYAFSYINEKRWHRFLPIHLIHAYDIEEDSPCIIRLCK